jgi:hypothetical protein
VLELMEVLVKVHDREFVGRSGHVMVLEVGGDGHAVSMVDDVYESLLLAIVEARLDAGTLLELGSMLVVSARRETRMPGARQTGATTPW